MKTAEQSLSVLQRLQLPMPAFFKKVHRAGVALTAISGALLVAPAGLPAGVTAVAGYLAVAGTVMTVVSQATVSQDVLAVLPDAKAATRPAAEEPYE
jgi:hypothetical protein